MQLYACTNTRYFITIGHTFVIKHFNDITFDGLAMYLTICTSHPYIKPPVLLDADHVMKTS